ncbi:hypothetical protein [Microlunatus ginsengisoli]|uniref:MinD-like ATPase involved in chromosome partitioning or flagellar assembly n=1 Tax=Microlunatus ginsengisoli TaxID=363863 RepID=A0ABP7A159_9ACTN
MGILVLTSASGSPGVTTLAVGLALGWPRSVLLADCDPGAHQAVLAGFLGGRGSGGKGLLRVAEAHRDRRALQEVIIDQTVRLTDESEPSRLLLPGFGKPGSATLFAGVWPDLVDAFHRLDDADFDVIVDAGRTTAHGLPMPLVESAATIAVVLNSSLRAVTAARVHRPTLVEQARSTTAEDQPGLIVIGPNDPYSPGEIGRALDAPVIATIAHDPAAAAHLSDGRPRPRRFEHSAFARSLADATTSLAAGLRRHADRVRV